MEQFLAELSKLTREQWMQLFPYIVFAFAAWAPMIGIGVYHLSVIVRNWRQRRYERKHPRPRGGGLLI